MEKMHRNGKYRIGIMGGSFDPIHKGHVSLAVDALEQADLDYVVIVPAGRQPFKLDATPASGEDRLNMVELALEGNPRLIPCDLELKREGISYTYLTLRSMQELLGPGADLFFIVGADSILKLETWMNSDELLSTYSFIAGSRPGYEDHELKLCMIHLEEIYGTRIIMIENDLLDISSTDIRERARKGEELSDHVDPKVERYIKEHGLYR